MKKFKEWKWLDETLDPVMEMMRALSLSLACLCRAVLSSGLAVRGEEIAAGRRTGTSSLTTCCSREGE